MQWTPHVTIGPADCFLKEKKIQTIAQQNPEKLLRGFLNEVAFELNLRY